MRAIAMYLPQYHEVEENNIWWGKGFTEWNSVKEAKPYFKNHYQPKVPLEENYYDLSDEDAKTWQWQANLAKEYGVDGFCVYHYWFKGGRQILERPMDILLKHEEIEIDYFFCWANEPWKRTWYSYNQELLLEQEYGLEDEWIEHYRYFSKFFSDDRYIKMENKPVLAIYRSAAIDELEAMRKTWDKLAKEDGYDGIYIISGNTSFEKEKRTELVDAMYRFEPAYTLHYCVPKLIRIPLYIRKKMIIQINKIAKRKRIEDVQDMRILYKYMPVSNFVDGKKEYPGICPSWDNTPRKKWKGAFFRNASPESFYKKLKLINDNIDRADFVFINAWNEWSEGAYLEPDEKNGYAYLEAIKRIKEE